jgi:predicted TPR repeat methyltransferase
MSAVHRSGVLDRVYNAGSFDELQEAYDTWAETYDDDVFNLGYTFPAVAAGFAGRYISAGSRIFDAGAGTGIIGATLKALDYDDIVGIDLSEGMLAMARERGCYRELHRMVLGEPLDLPSSAFDAGVSVGVFTQGHAPPSAFDELVRVIRPGGHMLFTIREDVYLEAGFKEKQATLEWEGEWRLVKRSRRFQPFPKTEPDIFSYVFVYQIG